LSGEGEDTLLCWVLKEELTWTTTDRIITATPTPEIGICQREITGKYKIKNVDNVCRDPDQENIFRETASLV
jgi:hypothetical protein